MSSQESSVGDQSSSEDTETEFLRIRLERKERKRREERERGARRKKPSSALPGYGNDDKKKTQVSKGDKPGSLKYFKTQGRETGQFAMLVKRIFFRHLCQKGFWPSILDKSSSSTAAYEGALTLWRELKQVGPEAIRT